MGSYGHVSHERGFKRAPLKGISGHRRRRLGYGGSILGLEFMYSIRDKAKGSQGNPIRPIRD